MCADMAKGLKLKEDNTDPLIAKPSSSYDKSVAYAGAAQRSASRKKASAAFRTISEVADELGVKQHVLRFWETKFSQLKPLKRGGGRRYYRPEDIELLRAVHRLLYVEGYTIKGVQKLLRDGGKKQIVAVFSGEEDVILSGDVDEENIVYDDDDLSEPSVEQQAPCAPAPVGAAANLTSEQREALEAVLAELKELRGMIKPRR